MNVCVKSYHIYSESRTRAAKRRYFSQPRFLKYHIGTTALAAISATV